MFFTESRILLENKKRTEERYLKNTQEVSLFHNYLYLILILTVSNPYKYHSFSFIFHLASSLALKGGDSTERGVRLGGGGGPFIIIYKNI
jgi:hypothetical protein